MSVTVAYPYDPTGSSAVCYIKGESYALSSINNTFRCIVPESAPFYQKDLVVIHYPSGKTLTEGVDYYLGHRYQEVAAIASLPLYGSISFINPELAGEIVLDYRTVGGPFIPVKHAVANYLINLLIDPVTTTWEAVFNKPEFYPPVDHEQIWSDFVNTDEIAESVLEIDTAVADYASKKDIEAVAYLNSRLTQLDNLISSTQFDQHIINTANPHAVSYAQADALNKDAQAVAAIQLYALTLQELAAYINSRGITQAHLDAFLSKSDDAIVHDRLLLKDSTAKIRSSGLTSSVDLSNGNITLTCVKTAKVLANADRSVTDESALLKAGANTLRVRGSGTTPNAAYLTYNDKVVIHLGNLRQYLQNVSFGTVHVTTQNTATGQWAGLGTTADPISITPIMPATSEAVKGVGKISLAITSVDRASFAAAKALADVVAKLSSYVPKTRTVNTHPLDVDINLTKAEFGLNLVDNTSDLNKPISTAQQTELDKLAPKVHQHDAGEVIIPTASLTQYGTTRVSTGLSDMADGKVASPNMLLEIKNKDTVTNTKLPQVLDDDILSFIHYIPAGAVTYPTQTFTYEYVEVTDTTTTIPHDPASWWLFTLPSGVVYSSGVVYDVPAIAWDMTVLYAAPANRTVYIHVVLSDGDATYVIDTVKRLDTMQQLYVGELTTNATQAVSTTLDRRISLGVFRELAAHIAATTGVHNFDSDVLRTRLGVGLLEDYPLTHTFHGFSPYNILKNWEPLPASGNADQSAWAVASNNSYLSTTTYGKADPRYGKYFNADMWSRLQSIDATTKVAKYTLITENVLASGQTITTNDLYRNIEVVIGRHVSADGVVHLLVMKYVSALATPGNMEAYLVYMNSSFTNNTTPIAGTNIVGPNTAILLGQYNAGPGITEPNASTTHVGRFYFDVKHREVSAARSIEITVKPGGRWQLGTIVAGDATERYITSTVSLAAIAAAGKACPYLTELFNSGVAGFFNTGGQGANIAYTGVTTPVSKQVYASANMIMELIKRGVGVSCTSGVVSGAYNRLPIPFGCDKCIILVSPRQLVNSASTTDAIQSFTNLYWASNHESSDVDKGWLNVYAVSALGSSTNVSTHTFNYTVIGFRNEIDLIEID